MDIHEIANTPRYGTGAVARDKLAEIASVREHLPKANEVPAMVASNTCACSALRAPRQSLTTCSS